MWCGGVTVTCAPCYAGTTPKSSGIFTTLQSLCQQIASNYKVVFEDTPEDFQELSARFWELLKVGFATCI